MPFGGLLTVGLIGAGGSIFSGIMGSSAAKTAAQQQADSAQQALDFQKQIWQTEQQNQAPFLQAGQTSIGMLMQGLQNGTFGPGSNPSFSAPTLEEARSTPGYQFTAQQGSKGILQGAAAAGGAISGGTLKALDQYNTGLADTTYNDVFNRSLATYSTGLQKQAQEYQQLYNPAALGEGSVQALNNSGTATANNVGNLMTQIGNAQASGTVGSANAISSGVTGGVNNFLQMLMLGKYLGTPGAPAGGGTPSLSAADLARLGISSPGTSAGAGPG